MQLSVFTQYRKVILLTLKPPSEPTGSERFSGGLGWTRALRLRRYDLSITIADTHLVCSGIEGGLEQEKISARS